MTFLRLAGLIPALFSLGILVLVVGCGDSSTSDTSSTSETGADSAAEADGDETANLMPMPKSAPPSGYEFESPVRIKAGDEYVSVDTPGYACPTMADVDGDGKEDLVVGQFNKGYMQFCRNIASSNEPPEFDSAEWIMSGDEKAQVPGVW